MATVRLVNLAGRMPSAPIYWDPSSASAPPDTMATRTRELAKVYIHQHLSVSSIVLFLVSNECISKNPCNIETEDCTTVADKASHVIKG